MTTGRKPSLPIALCAELASSRGSAANAPCCPEGASELAPQTTGDGCCAAQDGPEERAEPSPAALQHTADDDCCAAKGDAISAISAISALAAHADVRRVLVLVLVINLAMFFIELTAGVIARSTSLMADSVDMLGDAFVYALSLYALERGPRWRAGAALAKGAIIAVFGVSVAVEVLAKLALGVTPQANVMVAFGALALAANLTCLALLYRHRDRDVNMSSTFECSRNDVIANTGVLVAAAGVHVLHAGWPDIVVGAVIAVLFFRSAIKVLREAWPKFRASPATSPAT